MTVENRPGDGEPTMGASEATLLRALGDAGTAQYRQEFGAVWEPSDADKQYFRYLIGKNPQGETS